MTIVQNIPAIFHDGFVLLLLIQKKFRFLVGDPKDDDKDVVELRLVVMEEDRGVVVGVVVVLVAVEEGDVADDAYDNRLVLLLFESGRNKLEE